MIYLDNAATTGKKPQCVKNAVNYTLANLCANPGRGGHKASVDAAIAVYSAREKAAEFFGADSPDRVVFCHNCTTALNFVIKGLIKENDHVVVSDLEHNAVMRPLKKTGADYEKATVSLFNDEETVREFEKRIKPDTKMVICTAASNVIGKILPLKKIGKLCKDKNVTFLVDGAQGAGIMPIDMRDMNIDFLCIAAHKGLYAPMGCGILLANKDIENSLIEGGNGMESLSLYQSPQIPEGFESGTVSLPLIMGTKAGIGFTEYIGTEKIYSHEIKLIRYIYEKLREEEKFIFYTPYPEYKSFAPVLSFNVDGYSSEEVGEYLNGFSVAVRAGYHCSASAHEKLGTESIGTVRVSTSYFNDFSEVCRFVNIVKKIKNRG